MGFDTNSVAAVFPGMSIISEASMGKSPATSCAISWSSRGDRGTALEGFRTQLFPVSQHAPSAQPVSEKGVFRGVIAAHVPSGWYLALLSPLMAWILCSWSISARQSACR